MYKKYILSLLLWLPWTAEVSSAEIAKKYDNPDSTVIIDPKSDFEIYTMSTHHN